MTKPAIAERRRRWGLLVPVLGLAATAFLGFTASPAFSGFTAAITNSNNTIGTGNLLMQEIDANAPSYSCLSTSTGATIAANDATCSTINKFSGGGGQNVVTAIPGTVYTTTVTIKNTGSMPATTFTLTPSACAQSNNTAVAQWGSDTAFCGKVNLTISDDTATKCVFPVSTSACAAPSSTNTLATLGTTPITLATPIAAGASRNYTFKVQVDASVTNASQGLVASTPLKWAFAA